MRMCVLILICMSVNMNERMCTDMKSCAVMCTDASLFVLMCDALK